MVVICFPIRFEIPLRHQVFEHVQRQKLIAQPALVAMGIAVSDRLPGGQRFDPKSLCRPPYRLGDGHGTIVAADPPQYHAIEIDDT